MSAAATPWRLAGLLAGLALACLLPFFLSDYRTFQLTLVMVYAIALLGLNILTGFNGQFTLGHGAFYAIGSYTTAVLMAHYGVPYWATLPAAALVCLAAGFLFGLPALRLEGLFLALATLSLAVAMPSILKYRGIGELTGGVQGLVLTKPDAPFGLPLNPDRWLYFFTLAVAILMFLLAWNLLRGRVGRAIVAIRDQPIAARAMGINAALYKSMTFGVSAMYAGVAGGLGAIAVQFVAPDSFQVGLSFVFLIGAVIGGIYSIAGAVFGAFFVFFVPHISEGISRAAPQAIFGAFLIVFMFVMPIGIAGFLRLAAAWARRRTHRSPHVTGEAP
ncbi:MAG TPA: branched-chain amino acid ABC transporter permease [Burkholderiales bacterium]